MKGGFNKLEFDYSFNMRGVKYYVNSNNQLDIKFKLIIQVNRNAILFVTVKRSEENKKIFADSSIKLIYINV